MKGERELGEGMGRWEDTVGGIWKESDVEGVGGTGGGEDGDAIGGRGKYRHKGIVEVDEKKTE